MLDYWRLAGPARFLADVLNEIACGRNIVIRLPEVGPHGLFDRLRDGLRDRWTIRTLLGGDQEAPLRAIYRCLIGEVPVDAALSTTRLAADERLMGKMVFVQDIDDANWAVWTQFIEDYAVGCRLQPEDRRMLVVLVARGNPAKSPPPSEVALAVLCWNGWIGEIDMLVYASLRLYSTTLTPRKRQLIATCLARIALWDIEVIDEFCSGDPKKALEPIELLRKMGENRGWTMLKKPNWQDGSAHEIDGTEQVHSAYLACHKPDSIMRRVWSAQASVLLPLIEERRTELLPMVSRYIKFPVETKAGTVQQLEDLEIGHMWWCLNAVGAERSLVRRVERLKRVRDALAHLESVPSEMAFHPDLLG